MSCNHAPGDYYDWKITVLFYVGIHYVKALASQLGIDIGDSHIEIRASIKPETERFKQPQKMEFSRNAYAFYDYLYKSSKMSRYNGFVDNKRKYTDAATYNAIMAAEHKMCEEALDKLKLYLFDKRRLDPS